MTSGGGEVKNSDARTRESDAFVVFKRFAPLGEWGHPKTEWDHPKTEWGHLIGEWGSPKTGGGRVIAARGRAGTARHSPPTTHVLVGRLSIWQFGDFVGAALQAVPARRHHVLDYGILYALWCRSVEIAGAWPLGETGDGLRWVGLPGAWLDLPGVG
jgi:hypothetical protein